MQEDAGRHVLYSQRAADLRKPVNRTKGLYRNIGTTLSEVNRLLYR